MSKTAENALWAKAKDKSLAEYGAAMRQLSDDVAARNFSQLPGFAMATMINMEVMTKIQLQELNEAIIKEAVERELKSIGLAYDLDIKTQQIEWETRKQALLTALEKEIAAAKAQRQFTEEEITQLVIEQEIRGIALIVAKAEIDEALEGLKQQMILEEGGTLTYERQLAAAKYNTAEKKLLLIPYLEQAIIAQKQAMDIEETQVLPARQDLVNKQVEKATAISELLPYMELRVAAIEALISKRLELLPYLIEKANTTKEYADTVISQLVNHLEIARTQKEMAIAKLDRIAVETSLLAESLTVERQKLEIDRKKTEIDLIRAKAKEALAQQLIYQYGLLWDSELKKNTEELNYIRTLAENEYDNDKAKLEILEKAQHEANINEMSKEGSVMLSLASADRSNQKNIANLTNAAKLTQELTHLLAT